MVKKRLVVEAVVAKRLVEVAALDVELTAVKFWRVDEEKAVRPPLASILKSSAPAELVKERNFPVKDGVDEALKIIPVVPVALTWKRADLSNEAVVVAPTTNDLNGDEVAERKSPPATSSNVLPKPAPESESTPSQSPAPPVIAVQKAARVVPVVPKIESVPPPIAKFVVEAFVAKRLVEVAELVVELTAVKF